MNIALPARVVRDWYRRRRRVWKILIWTALGLVAAVVLYVAARAVQYATSRVSASEFLPDNADLVLEVPDLDATLPRIFATDAWEHVDRRLLREQGVRRELNVMLERYGLPTLDDLEDERFHRKSGNLYRLETLSRIAGRDFSAALFFNEQGRGDFCAVTQLTFKDHLVLPFAWLAPGLIGAEKETIRGWSCLVIKQKNFRMWVTSAGRVAIVASSRKAMEEALRRRGPKKGYGGVFRIRADFTRSRMMEDVRRMIALGPAGAFLRGVDLGLATGVTVEGDAAGRDFLLRTRWTGVPRPAAKSPIQLARYAPHNSTALICTTTGAAAFWRWYVELVGESAGTRNIFVNTLRDVGKRLKDAPFEEEFLPLTGDGACWIFGSEEWGGGLYPAMAVTIPVTDSKKAYRALHMVISDMKLFPEEYYSHTQYQGYEFSFVGKLSGVTYEPVARFCYARLADAVLLGNNPEFMRRILDAAAGTEGSILDSGDVREFTRASDERDMRGILDPDLVLSVFLSLNQFYEGFDGAFPIVADPMVDGSAAAQVRLREQIMRERPGLSVDKYDSLVIETLEAMKREMEQDMRRHFQYLKLMRWLTAQARFEGDELDFRILLRVK